MLRALIFDFDGVILDTESPEFRAWQDVYAGFDAILPLAEWAKGIGAGRNEIAFDVYAYLDEQIGRSVDRAQVRRLVRARAAELVALEGPRPGVAALLADARARDVRRGIASSSPHDWVDGHLARLGLADQFEVIRCCEDVARTKPNPDLYLAALDSFGVRPDEAVALEDSPNGILAAKRAGLYCVGVPNPITGQLDLSQADRLVESLDSLSLAELSEALVSGD